MRSLIVVVIKVYLKILGRLAPKTAGRQGFQLFCTPRFRAPVPPAGQTVLERAERLDLRVGDEGVVGYRWRRSAEDDSPLVVLVHGWESRAGRLTQWVDPLLDAGFQVAAFDAPAHGASEGKGSNPMKFAQALIALAQQVGPVTGLVGHSVGGLSCLLALGGGAFLDGSKGQTSPLKAQRLVVVAGAESGVDGTAIFCRTLGLNAAFHERMLDAMEEAIGFPMRAFDGHRLFPNQPLPTLWLHDPKDGEVPIDGARKMAAISDRITLEETPGLGHHRIARDPEIIRRGIAFLTAGLTATEVASKPQAGLATAPG